MQLTTILLIPSDNFNWVGLRAILADWPEVRVVADVQRRESALRLAAHEQPDLILAASDLAGMRLVPLVRDLRAASPHSRVVVFGKLLESEAHRELDKLDVAAFVQWKTATPERIRLILAAVRAGELYVGCKGVVERLRAPERRRRARPADSPALTPTLRAVILGLSAERTRQEFADEEGVSVHTIDDRIHALKRAFGVRSSFMLGVLAERLGFIP